MKNYTLPLLILAACEGANEDAALLAEARQHYSRLPADFATSGRPLTEEAVALGRMLFYDVRLSKNHDLSCNSCHDLMHYGVDGRRFSLGHRNQEGNRNAPTVYNAGAGLAQFWDGRAADVETQATGPIRNPVEMAMPSDQQVVDTVSSMPEYVQSFGRAFPAQAVTLARIGEAIGAFERRLATPGRWDRFLDGDLGALNASERAGLRTFLSVGCATCHAGPALGGTSYRKAGAARPWPGDNQDPGRYEVTKDEMDRNAFKVPTLRNIARTSPYFHDGSVSALPEAVRRMAAAALDKDLSDSEVAAIVSFLESLTGELPLEYIKVPPLPQSTPTTPLPDPT